MRSPPSYTTDEISAIDSYIPEITQKFEKMCVAMETLKPPLETTIQSHKTLLESLAKGSDVIDDGEDGDEKEDELDFLEKHRESTIRTLSLREEELYRLNSSLKKYRNL